MALEASFFSNYSFFSSSPAQRTRCRPLSNFDQIFLGIKDSCKKDWCHCQGLRSACGKLLAQSAPYSRSPHKLLLLLLLLLLLQSKYLLHLLQLLPLRQFQAGALTGLS